MSNAYDRHLILVADPEDGQWSIILETKNKAAADSFWKGMEGDQSARIQLYTGDFITFPISDEDKEDGERT